ncbi:hypothetical protein RB600_006420 [Gaeumannomyces tritici]
MGALEPHIDTALTRWEGSPGDMIVMLKIFWASTFPFYMTFYFCEAALLATLFQLIPPFMKKRRMILRAVTLRRAMKVGICCTFLLGVINIVFCLARFVEVERAVSPTGLSLSTVTLWSALDCTICVVIACLPSLRPYLRSRSQANTYADQYNYGASGKRRSTTVPTNATSATRAGGGPSTLRRGSAGFELIDDEGAPESSPKTMNVLRMTMIRVQSGTASGAGSRASSGSQNDRHLEGGDDGQKSDIELVHVVGK